MGGNHTSVVRFFPLFVQNYFRSKIKGHCKIQACFKKKKKLPHTRTTLCDLSWVHTLNFPSFTCVSIALCRAVVVAITYNQTRLWPALDWYNITGRRHTAEQRPMQWTHRRCTHTHKQQREEEEYKCVHTDDDWRDRGGCEQLFRLLCDPVSLRLSSGREGSSSTGSS